VWKDIVMNDQPQQQKIIHVDMDCFYAAIEVRDNPSLSNKPVAVGGAQSQRGVLCTCNYIARQYGVHSAMSTAYALKLCPDLIVLPVSMDKYRAAAVIIRSIFHEYTNLVEPLALDEAYLDVTNSIYYNGSATLIAKAIKEKIFNTVQITASAGVAPNKFLAKIASGWKKPNGLFVIPPHEVQQFISHLPVKKLYGVGKVTGEKLNTLGLHTCFDLQKFTLLELTNKFGKLGSQLYYQSRGVDHRPVEPNRIRKSLSVEKTFSEDIFVKAKLIVILKEIFSELNKRIKENASDRKIKNQYIKIKFSNFKQISLERSNEIFDYIQYEQLLFSALKKERGKIRLIGIGVHFVCDKTAQKYIQQELLFI
jgi:DNA polymerase-4